MHEKIIANIIVDLYEMRVSTMHKYQDKYEQVRDMSKYHFFTSAIAQLYDKYKVSQDLIEEVIRERSFEKNLIK